MSCNHNLQRIQRKYFLSAIVDKQISWKEKNKQLYFRKFRYSMIRGNNFEEFRLIIQWAYLTRNIDAHKWGEIPDKGGYIERVSETRYSKETPSSSG